MTARLPRNPGPLDPRRAGPDDPAVTIDGREFRKIHGVWSAETMEPGVWRCVTWLAATTVPALLDHLYRHDVEHHRRPASALARTSIPGQLTLT